MDLAHPTLSTLTDFPNRRPPNFLDFQLVEVEIVDLANPTLSTLTRQIVDLPIPNCELLESWTSQIVDLPICGPPNLQTFSLWILNCDIPKPKLWNS